MPEKRKVEQPWDFDTAYHRCIGASQRQEAIEEEIREAYKSYAEAEEKYRTALAAEIVRAHDDGVAWSTAPDLARGDDTVARLRRERDIQEGVKEAMLQAAWRRVADRKDAQRFSDWSMRRELAEGYGNGGEPQFEAPIGGQR